MIQAIIFDMDGLLVDSETYWEEARAHYCRSRGCDWRPEDELGVKGHNSAEWAAVIAAHCGLSDPLDIIIAGVIARMRGLYDEKLPLLPGALDTVRALAERYPLAVASSSPVDVIEFVTAEAGIRDLFGSITSSDEAGKGKPSPDVFLLAATRLGVEPATIAVFEDSSSGITAGYRAGMSVIAVPNPHYPVTAEALALATLTLKSLLEFEPAQLEAL